MSKAVIAKRCLADDPSFLFTVFDLEPFGGRRGLRSVMAE
jgi:hypothetical protein